MSTNDQENNPAEPDVPETIRPAFYDAVAELSKQFAKDVLRLVPELDGIAVIPSWSRSYGEHIFFGVMAGRHGDGLRPPMETMHMATQLHRALNHVVEQSYRFLTYLDQKTAEKWAELRQVNARLAEVDTHGKTNQAPAPRWTPEGGAPPSAPPEGENL